MSRFIVKQGAQPGSTIEFQDGRLTFGRTDDVDVILNDANVSRRHAQAVLIHGQAAILDLESSNGTYVNGIPISRALLLDGDEVAIGGTTLIFLEDKDGSSPALAVRPDPQALAFSVTPKLGEEEVGDDPLSPPIFDGISHTRLFSAPEESNNSDTLKQVYLKLKSLYRVFYEVTQATSLKEMFESVGRTITLSTPIERVSFYLYAEKTGGGWQKFVSHASTRLADPDGANAPYMPLIERARSDMRAVQARIDENDRCVFHDPASNALAIPLMRQGKIAALMYADNPQSHLAFNKNDSDFLSTLALQLAVRLNQFEQVQQLTEENQQLRHFAAEAAPDATIIVANDKMKQILAAAERVARTDSSVLVTGESGTGKEMIARTVHRFSSRGNKPLIAVNCAALPETLLESELFGHEKGAFTGAVERRKGKFELADTGTLFLDEIGDISASAQAKLLRVLQEGELQRVGGSTTIKVNVRLIAATNKDLAEEVRAGRFRQDLYFRLRVIDIFIPPLRQRPEDVKVLAEHFFHQLKKRIPTDVKCLHATTLTALTAYPFPGNVRELRNVIERGLVFAFGEEFLPEHLPAEVLQPGQGAWMNPQGGAAGNQPLQPRQAVSLAEVEKDHIQFVLKFVKGNKLKAAQLLGISRTTLYEKLKLYELGSAEEEQAI